MDLYAKLDYKTLGEKYNIAARQAYQTQVEEWREMLDLANQRVKIEQASKTELSSTGETKLVAVTSGGEGMINMHFGSASEFLIYEAGDKAIKFVQHRKVESPYCTGETCDGTNPIAEIKDLLKDCDLLLTEKIGECPMDELREINLVTDESYAQKPIEISIYEAVAKHFYSEKEEG